MVLGAQFRVMAIPTPRPEVVQRLVVRRPSRVIQRPLHRAEGADIETPKASGIGLALGEETHPEAGAAIVGEQHRLTEVEDPLRVPAALAERPLEFIRLVGHGQAGGGAHHPFAVQGEDEQAFRGLGIGSEVTRFVLQRAVVEVGKFAEHGKSQAGEVVDMRRDGGALEQADMHGSGRSGEVDDAPG
ncbi:hypothetical protein D9M71_609940 [compost metagenome]